MPTSVTVEDLLAAQKTLVSAVDDIGVVLTDLGDDSSEEEFIGQFISVNEGEDAGKPKGVMILWREMRQRHGPDLCRVLQTHRFMYHVVYPVELKRPDGSSSYSVFIRRVQEINNALNATTTNTPNPWNLGVTLIGSEVDHQHLQQLSPIDVRQWGSGEGVRTHYAQFSLDVNCVVFTN